MKDFFKELRIPLLIGFSVAFVFVIGFWIFMSTSSKTEQKKENQKVEITQKTAPAPTKQEEVSEKKISTNEPVNTWKITLYVFILWILLSLKTIGPTEQGVILLFGKPIINVSSGLVFTPFLLCRLEKETRLNIQDELPTEPEKIWRGDGTMPDDLVKQGFKPPIRINFGPGPKEGDPNYDDFKDDPYNKQMVVEVVPVITWWINDYKEFIQRIGSKEEARRQMQDTTIARFTIDFAKTSPAMVLRNLEKHSADLEKDITGKVKSWGITIVSAQIKPFNFSHSLNTFVTEVAEAAQKAKKTVIDAKANAEKIVVEGEAIARATLAKITAEADGARLLVEARAIGVRRLAEIAETPEGQITLWLDTMTKGFEKAQHTIVPGSEFFTALSNIKSILDKTKGVL